MKRQTFRTVPVKWEVSCSSFLLNYKELTRLLSRVTDRVMKDLLLRAEVMLRPVNSTGHIKTRYVKADL
ncbi:unnamed protein product [Nippostrongylus brasiliensis]|uniref:Transposase n=1 Tax=Nippostrongylus brasiliensis TaxID=27835 RepID=A0A0N4XRZ5_NIPBR|nr:unnamed protein product [Nippostrongylus brasiliensis]